MVEQGPDDCFAQAQCRRTHDQLGDRSPHRLPTSADGRVRANSPGGRTASEREDLIRLAAELGRLRRGGPAPTELREILVGRPTGDGASLSDVNRNGVVPELCNQLAHRWHADAVDLIEVVAQKHLGSVTRKDHRDVVAHFDRTVDGQVER